jgi:putative transposase
MLPLWPVRFIFSVLQTSANEYYAWLKSDTASSGKAARLTAEVPAAYRKMRGTSGAERSHPELVAGDCAVSLWKVKRMRRKLGLICKRKLP